LQSYDQLVDLKNSLDEGRISKDEFDKLKSDILLDDEEYVDNKRVKISRDDVRRYKSIEGESRFDLISYVVSFSFAISVVGEGQVALALVIAIGVSFAIDFIYSRVPEVSIALVSGWILMASYSVISMFGYSSGWLLFSLILAAQTGIWGWKGSIRFRENVI